MMSGKTAESPLLTFEEFREKYLERLRRKDAQHEIEELTEKDLRDFYENYQDFVSESRCPDLEKWANTFEG